MACVRSHDYSSLPQEDDSIRFIAAASSSTRTQHPQQQQQQQSWASSFTAADSSAGFGAVTSSVCALKSCVEREGLCNDTGVCGTRVFFVVYAKFVGCLFIVTYSCF